MSEQYESVDLVGDETVKQFTGAVLIAALTAGLAQLNIPMPGGLPAFSLQLFGMFFAGLLLGPLWGGFAWALYLLVGIAGAPVFSNGSAGLGYILVGQGTGGFLVGFLVGAVISGAIIHRGIEPRPLSTVSIPVQVAGLLGSLVAVYAIGVPWLANIVGWSISRAATFMAPYAVLDLVKLGVAVGIVKGGYLVRR